MKDLRKADRDDKAFFVYTHRKLLGKAQEILTKKEKKKGIKAIEVNGNLDLSGGWEQVFDKLVDCLYKLQDIMVRLKTEDEEYKKIEDPEEKIDYAAKFL